MLQQDIQNIFQWTIRNKLPLNLSKCSVMHMTRSISPNFCRSYFMGDGKLDEVDDLKLLGVTFSKNLSFVSQVGLVSDRISKLSGFIIRCTRNMTSTALLNLYKVLILPHVMYCIVFGLPINIIILIGCRGFRGKLLGFRVIQNVTVILKVDPTILKDLLIAIWWSWRMSLIFNGWFLVSNHLMDFSLILLIHWYTEAV